MRSLRIVVEPYASNHLKQVVEDGLGLYNVAVTGFAEYYPVAIFLKDENSAILRGVPGHLWGKWLRVAILWLAELVRRQGYGSQLLLAAEAYARERGCRHVQLVDVQFPGPSVL
jgi:GNAT superfamily N-acetyltransferase